LIDDEQGARNDDFDRIGFNADIATPLLGFRFGEPMGSASISAVLRMPGRHREEIREAELKYYREAAGAIISEQ
jgi:hypothetical protein